jgi:hypothetical protein
MAARVDPAARDSQQEGAPFAGVVARASAAFDKGQEPAKAARFAGIVARASAAFDKR